MAKSALLRGRSVKVENRSSFDKSFLNLLTTNVGTITPILKQLVIPSSGKVRIPIHLELPPLATDAYLRSHLKLEAFYCPLRLCYGGFQSWFAGEPVWDGDAAFTRAELPRVFVPEEFEVAGIATAWHFSTDDSFDMFGQGSLLDYFDVRFPIRDGDLGPEVGIPLVDELVLESSVSTGYGVFLNIFPFLCYHLIYDHFYRNKSVSRPGFTPSVRGNGDSTYGLLHDLPFSAYENILTVVLGSSETISTAQQEDTTPSALFAGQQGRLSNDVLLNGYYLWELRQRNFGDDYFTAARPSAQAGSPVTVQVDANGKFTIASLRAQNAFQEFAEVNSYATPDYVQTNMARYGVSPSDAVVQKPVLLGSADFPIFTKSVELNNNLDSDAAAASGNVRNPFAKGGILGAKAGVASGNGTFEFDFDVKEPGYIMVMATLVPEACYSTGVSKDMRSFIKAGSLVDLPVGLLEHVGDEPIFENELNVIDDSSFSNVFGYVQRYLAHKVGNVNQVHGLFRDGMSLQAFSVQRVFDDNTEISSEFLEVPKTALDGVSAVENGISDYGVMLDCAIEMFVSEPLSESALPALSNPASEHGRSVYVQNGGSKLA